MYVTPDLVQIELQKITSNNYEIEGRMLWNLIEVFIKLSFDKACER